MSRPVLLVFVAICWAGVAVDGVVHLLMGDLILPASLLAVFAIWLTLWHELDPKRPTEQPVQR